MLLKGIRILDLTTAIAGPTATQILGDLGAEVIKIEGPRHAERMRLINTPASQLTSQRVVGSSWFSCLNRNKLGICIDLTRTEGKDLFKALVRVSDMVIENYTPRVMPNFGLDYAALKEVNPAIIYIAMPGYGNTGPYREYPSWGETIEATAGLAHLTGHEDGPPLRSGIIMPDGLAGVNGAFAAILCLRQRMRTGQGQHVVLSQLEGSTQLVGEAILDFAMNGRVQQRTGNRRAHQAPRGVYPCAGDEAWVAIAVGTQEQWRALCRVMGDPAWTQLPEFATPWARHEHHDALDRHLSAWTRTLDKHEVMHRLQQVGVPAGAVLDADDLVQDPHLNDRGFFWEYGESFADDGPTYPYPGPRAKFEGRAEAVQYRAPAFAEHNARILEGVLGLTREQIEALLAADVIRDVLVYA